MSIFIDSCARGVTREPISQIVKNFNIEEIYVLFYDKNVEPKEIANLYRVDDGFAPFFNKLKQCLLYSVISISETAFSDLLLNSLFHVSPQSAENLYETYLVNLKLEANMAHHAQGC